MICVRLEGGLGNQLFQYSAGRSLAQILSTDLILDLSELKSCNSNVTPRNFELDNFNIKAEVSLDRELPFYRIVRHFPFLSRIVSKWDVYVENTLNYDCKFPNLGDSTLLVGYWQSYRYFSAISETLITELVHKKPLSNETITLLSLIESSNAVAIHVRRGDYVSLPSAKNFHGALNLGYYQNAINELTKCYRDLQFFVFSDDVEWCKLNLHIEGDVFYVDHNTGFNSWQDLVLMSHCRHHIIANSSFSWWSAWIADHHFGSGNDRIVFAPARWFSGQPYIDLNDRFPMHWQVR